MKRLSRVTVFVASSCVDRRPPIMTLPDVISWRYLPDYGDNFCGRAPVAGPSWVESRKGAVPEPTGNWPVSLPRSSNRTCGFTTSGFPTGFGATPTAAIPDSDAARQRLGTTTFMLPYSLLKRSSELQRLADSASMATPSLRHQHTRSKGPFLRQHYLASSVVWPSPTPVRPAACATVGLPAPVGTGLPR